MHHSEWVENADRWVAGFLEKFEEGCHIMVRILEESIRSYYANRVFRPSAQHGD